MGHGDAVEGVTILAGIFDDHFAGAIGQSFRAEGVEVYGAGRLRGRLRHGLTGKCNAQRKANCAEKKRA
jgi:hypothetical protein